MKLFIEAKKFIIKQRIKELETALRHWPNSQYYDDRYLQLMSLKTELERLDEDLQ